MVRNIKALGVVVVAVLAIGALAASAAHAAGLTAGTNTKAEKTAFFLETKITPTVFKGFGVSTKCENSEFTGEQTLPSESMTVALHAATCSTLGLPSTVTAHECNFVFHVGEKIEESKYGVTTDVECPTGQSLEIEIWLNAGAHAEGKTPACIVKVGTQTGLKGMDFVVDKGVGGAKDDITEEGAATNIKATLVKNSILCPSGTETSEGVFELPNKITYQATEDTPLHPIVDLWIE